MNRKRNGHGNRIAQPAINVRMTTEEEKRYLRAMARYGHRTMAGFTRFLLEAAARPHKIGTLRLWQDMK